MKNLKYRTQLNLFTPHVIIKEQGGSQFLQIGIIMAKLWPLLNHYKSFLECILY